ncbi:MAG: DUF1905 domain-containing protein [Candidatus Woesebacteria bacterium]
MIQRIFTVTAKVWLYPGKTAWHFVSIPIETTKEIDFYFAHEKRGWGSLPVRVTIGESIWKTSIFPDKKTGTFLLPIKAAVRKAENIQDTDAITLILEVLH